jgi:predicted DsbA family dithiol-disulfide isomerase
MFANVEFDIRWRPFQLNADMPPGKGVDKMGYYNSRFGTEKVRSMLPQMIQTGASEGIKFSYGGSIGNTFDSHRLIWKARQEGGSELQDKIVDSIFKAYFEEEKSLGELSVLEECAKDAGIDATALLADTSIGKQEVSQEMKEFRTKYQCNGVPFFIIDGKHTMSGAQPPEEFVAVFEELV